MSAERRLTKRTRSHIRKLKAHIRHEVGAPPQIDSHIWSQVEEILRLTPDYSDNYAPYHAVLKEYCQIRVEALGNPAKLVELNTIFRQKHADVLEKLKPVFGKISAIIPKIAI